MSQAGCWIGLALIGLILLRRLTEIKPVVPQPEMPELDPAQF